MLFHKRCFSSPHQLISAIRVIYVRANFGRAKGCTAWYSCNKIFWPNRLQIDLRKRKPNLPLLCCFGFYTCWQLYYNQKWKWGQKIVEKVLLHCVKSVLIQSYSGPHFPAFGLNTERYSVSLRIQSECGEIRTRKNPVSGHF